MAVSTLLASPVLAATVISPSNKGTWDFQTNAADGLGQFVTGPGTPPAGAGSVELASGSNGSNFSAIHTTAYDGQSTTNFANAAASYATYVPVGASNASYPKLIVDVNINTTTTTIPDELTFDPRDQLQAPVAGVWQSWDALNGKWGSTLPCSAFGPGTLAQYLANCLPGNVVSISVRTRADGTGGVRFQVGPNAISDVLVGYVDNATLGFDGTNTKTYDFENNTIVLTTPTNKDECKKGGWQNFNNPVFKNQGSCVSFVEANVNAGK